MHQVYFINFIVPYFGKFPNYFQLFLNSCATNFRYHWTIITDNWKLYEFPKNVEVVHTSFEEVCQRIQNKFDFAISLNEPHKLCEFKPAYGYIFPEYTEGYRFWGYCDIDVIYGMLDHFITEEILAYDKIFILGHMTIIRNTKYLNELFMRPVEGKELYKEAFSSPDNFNFDEEYEGKLNINTIFETYGIRVWRDAVIADIYTKSSNFKLIRNGMIEDKMDHFFVWKNGVLLRLAKNNTGVYTREYMYIHLQKRKMKVQIRNVFEYKIIPNSFTDIEYSTAEIEKNFDLIKKKHMNLHYFKLRFNNLIFKCKRIFRRKWRCTSFL